MKTLKRITAVISLAVVMGMTGALAYAADITWGAGQNGKGSVWNVLTDEQKAQMASDMKDRLEQCLTDGRITQENYDSMITAIENGEMPGRGGGRRFMTDEQKAAFDAQKSKWDALTDSQKQEIYDLCNDKLTIHTKIIDKYLEFGVIDSDTAASMKEGMTQRHNNAVNNGLMPMSGKGGGRGRGMANPGI